MSRPLFRCQRCRYHYPPEQLVLDKRGWRLLVCADRAACDRRIALREFDRKAVQGR